MKSFVVVPLRRKSVRLEEKIFSKIRERELCLHVIDRLQESLKDFSGFEILAAIDDEKTRDVLKDRLRQDQIIMTNPALPSGTDRVYAAAKIYALEKSIPFENLKAVVNVQGDMPFLSIKGLKKFWLRVMEWQDNNPDLILTPYENWPEHADEKDLGNVKIVTDKTGRALYFSRYPIPCSRASDRSALKMHVGIYAYTPSAIEKFCRVNPTSLEKLEGLEQLRALYENIPIECICIGCDSGESFRGIDTHDDLKWAQSFKK